MNNRIEQLDSIRGLAAFIVVLNHVPFVALSLPIFAHQIIRWSGINNGHSSVMLFFILSGFVLSLPFLNKKGISYFPYIVKRFFRIYVPYIFAITFAIFLSQIFLSEKVDVVGDYEHMMWSTPLSIKLIVEHVYFLGNIHSNAFNGVIWSLIHELRISIIFPFIVMMVKGLNWRISLCICFFLSGVAGLNNIFNIQESNGYAITYFHTIHYTALFMLGALLAKHKNEVVSIIQKKHISFKLLLLGLSFFLFNFSEFIIHYLYEFTKLEVISTHFYILVEYGIALGCMGFIICALSSLRLEKVLMFKPIVFLGKISYSLYLYHLPVLLICIYLLYKVLPLEVISLIGIILGLTVSTIAWLLIEKPTIRIGRNLAKKISNKQIAFKSKEKDRTA